MKILRIGDDHYVAETLEQLERYALVLLNQRLTTGQVPDGMRALAEAVCTDEDANTAYVLLQRIERDVALIPGKIL